LRYTEESEDNKQLKMKVMDSFKTDIMMLSC